MAVFMCYLFSSLVTIVVVASVFENYHPQDLPEIERAMLIATQPIPLLIVFYWLITKGLRKLERNRLKAGQ